MSRKEEPCLRGRSRHSVSINARHGVNRCMQIQRSVCPRMDYRGWGLKSYLIDLIVDVGALSQMSGGRLGALPESTSWWWGRGFFEESSLFLKTRRTYRGSSWCQTQSLVSIPVIQMRTLANIWNLKATGWRKTGAMWRCMAFFYLRFQVYHFILVYCKNRFTCFRAKKIS